MSVLGDRISITDCKWVLVGGLEPKEVWDCGLTITVASVSTIEEGHYMASAASEPILQAAHEAHHEAEHQPSASLYLEGQPLTAAWCACLQPEE